MAINENCAIRQGGLNLMVEQGFVFDLDKAKKLNIGEQLYCTYTTTMSTKPEKYVLVRVS
jgi:hypothetical protein